MRLLHTSDWHLGKMLMGKRRHAEHKAFLDWLLLVLEEQSIDVLCVAGDIFDTSTPSAAAQSLYYSFLHKATAQGRCIIVTAGNHDSPSLLTAPAALLKELNVHVVGAATEPEAKIINVLQKDGSHGMVVGAVPFLHDREMRTVEAGESLNDKDRKLLHGIATHYEAVACEAERIANATGTRVPVVLMGHLFAAGGKVVEDEGLRELYIGAAARVPSSIFPETVDYVALGHLHVAQVIGGSSTRRYSGSPLPLSFSEAKDEKTVSLVVFDQETVTVEQIKIPNWQRLQQVRGTTDSIEAQLAKLVASNESIWVEVCHDAEQGIPGLRDRVEAAVAQSQVEVLRIKAGRTLGLTYTDFEDSVVLEELRPDEVFARCLEAYAIEPALAEELRELHAQLVIDLEQKDTA